MKSPYTIIVRPLITEKALLLSEKKDSPQYAFRVARDANKIEIRNAIEAIYNVKVVAVNTVKMRGKVKRQGRFVGRTSDWKKAIVSLQPGQSIETL